jgi:hypothetical protein
MADELSGRLVNATIDINDPGRLQRIVQPLERTHSRHGQRPDIPVPDESPTVG